MHLKTLAILGGMLLLLGSARYAAAGDGCACQKCRGSVQKSHACQKQACGCEQACGCRPKGICIGFGHKKGCGCSTCGDDCGASGCGGHGKGENRMGICSKCGPMPQTCYSPRYGCYFGGNRHMARYPAFHGYYYRRPYNYRNLFDYPWHAEPHEPTSLFSYNVPPAETDAAEGPGFDNSAPATPAPLEDIVPPLPENARRAPHDQRQASSRRTPVNVIQFRR